MAAVADADVSINTAGDIRWTGAATTNKHTILEFIQWLMDKQDDEQAAGDDLLDITVDTPFDRSTDQIVSLNFPFNIDDTFATHLYDGSVSQTDLAAQPDNTLYSGLNVIGPVEAGTEYMILQDGKVLPAFWGTGINPEAAPSLVFSRHLVKTRDRGADIDGKRISVLVRTLGDQYRRFPAALGTGNSVAAIGNGADIFNATADATIAGWTTIVNTEGFQELDIDNTGAAGQEFYSQWDTGSQSVNDTYERTKWISQTAHEADATSGAVTGTNYVVDNATIIGQAQSFIPLSGGEHLTEARWQLKIGGGTPVGPIFCELLDSDDASPGVPIGAVLARSEDILPSALTSAYEEIIFRFNRLNPSDGTDQSAGLALDNAEYYIALRNPTADASNFVHVDGSATSVDATQDRAEETGAWAGSGTTDLNLIVKSSPEIHQMPGEQMQGINVEVGFDNESGAGIVEDDMAFWGTIIAYDNLAGGPFFDGEYVTFVSAGVLVNGGRVLHDDGVDEIIVALENTTADTISDNDVILGLVSGATADVLLATHTGNGTDDLDFTTGPDEITRVTSGVSFITDGFKVGHRLTVTGSSSNNITTEITSVSATIIGVTATLTPEPNVAATITQEVTDDTIGGGIGVVLAKDDNGTTGEVYLQVISGVNPVNNARIRSPGSPLADYADATATVNTRTIIPEFLGTSTGSNIIGAYGIGFDPDDVGASDLFTSLDNTTRTPPNNVTFTVSGLVSGEDRVLVGPRDTVPDPDELDRGMWLVSTLLSGVAETDLVVKTGTNTVPFPPTPSQINWPASGTGAGNSRLRIQRDNGIYERIPYDSHDGTDTFTLGTPVTAAQQIDVTGGDTFTRVGGGDFLAEGYEKSATFTGAAFANGGNNAQFTCDVVTATTILVADSTGMVNETGTGDETLTGDGWNFLTTESGEAAINNDVFLAFVDVLANATSEAFTGVHESGADRNLFVRVRDGGATPIKTFESLSATFTSTSSTIAAVRTSDA